MLRETEIGKLPFDWDVLELGQICSLITDGSHYSPKEELSSFFMASVKDMRYNHFDFKNCKTISKHDFDALVQGNCSPNQGDILISKDGANCLDLMFVYDQQYKIVLLSSIAIIRLKDGFNPYFYAYYMRSPDAQFLMRNKFISGSAIPRVVLKDFRSVAIPIVPIAEQTVTTEVLKSLDDKIDFLHRQNKTLEQLAETLFRQWFVEEAKESWEEITLSEIAKHVKKNINPSNSPNIFFKHYSLPEFDMGKEPIVEIGREILSNKYQVVSNSILVSKLNPRTPRIWMVYGEITENNCICSTEFQVIKPKNNNWYGFIYCFLKSNRVTQELAGASSGTSGSHQRVNPRDIFNLSLLKPHESLVEKFDNITKEYWPKILNNQNQIRTLTQLRDTLLPKLMSGEVRVIY